jgi:hypothetical protein
MVRNLRDEKYDFHESKYPPVLWGWLAVLMMINIWAFPAQAGNVVPPAVPHDLVEETPNPGGFQLLTAGDYFTCDIPPDWTRGDHSFGLSAEEKGAYGITLHGPWRGEIPVKITLYYYAEGNLLYRSASHYLRLFSQPALGVALEGSSYGPVTKATVSGREALMFERVKNEFVPMHNDLGLDQPGGENGTVYERREIMARPVAVKERFVVLPVESGFYALRYSAASQNFQEFLPVFEKVTDTFYAKR